MKAYQAPVEKLLQTFHSNALRGLDKQEILKRRLRYGSNTIPEKKGPSFFVVFFKQFQSPLIYILLAAALIIFMFGTHTIDAFIISGILFFNAIIGTIQEGRTRNLLEQIKQFFTVDTIVIRNGEKQLIDASELVPGDIIVLREGEQVPADARIITSDALMIDQAVLTGESAPARKGSSPITEETPLAEQKNMIFKGTYIMSGSGTALVIRTGTYTQMGKIGLAVADIKTDTPIKQEINHLSYIILVTIIALCIFLFIVGFALGRPLAELLTMLTALFICVIPEGLPVVLTLVLVTGVYTMAKQKILVKKMQAVEGLGRAQVIIIDKTGTLTRNEMMVTKACVGPQVWNVTGEGYFVQGTIECTCAEKECRHDMHDLRTMGVISALLNSSEITFLPNRCLFTIQGDPTEAALSVFSQKVGLSSEQLHKEYKKVYEIPFHPDIRFHAGFFEYKKRGIILVNGSPEEICMRCLSSDAVTKTCLETLLEQGLRIVAFAQQEFDISSIPQVPKESEQIRTYFISLLHDLEFVGFCGLQDSIRSEVPAIITQARNAGITIVMATGDHHKTATHIAQQVGLYKEEDKSLDGVTFKNLSKAQLKNILPTTTVYSRLTPDDKLQLVKAFKAQGALVAMTGDGINDVPSLVAADLSIAMGSIGTEIAKQTADIILLDDSFASIVTAIEQGRHIFYSLKRVILYFLSTNLAEVLIIMGALLTNLPLPLTAGQILWLNFVTDGFLDIGLSMEPIQPGLLQEKHWIQTKVRLVDTTTLMMMLYMAVPMCIGSLAVFIWYLPSGLPRARTMALLTMAFFQWFNAWNCRSLHTSLLSMKLLRNKWLVLATLFVFALQVCIVYVPGLRYIFKTVPLSLAQWGVIISVSFSIIIWIELFKWFPHAREQKRTTN
jgi:P-type Ca2+ transporter type 2C